MLNTDSIYGNKSKHWSADCNSFIPINKLRLKSNLNLFCLRWQSNMSHLAFSIQNTQWFRAERFPNHTTESFLQHAKVPQPWWSLCHNCCPEIGLSLFIFSPPVWLYRLNYKLGSIEDSPVSFFFLVPLPGLDLTHPWPQLEPLWLAC